MACSCKGKKTNNLAYKVTFPDGKVTSYRSKTEAKMAVARKGGTWEEVG